MRVCLYGVLRAVVLSLVRWSWCALLVVRVVFPVAIQLPLDFLGTLESNLVRTLRLAPVWVRSLCVFLLGLSRQQRAVLTSLSGMRLTHDSSS